MLDIGQPAPEFDLKDQKGEIHSLEKHRGRWVVLYFYPKDDTPGCTTEACQLRDDFREFTQLGVDILGVSVDDIDSHAAFADKYRLPFPLLADTNGFVAGKYGALWNFWLLRFAKRHTFLIDPQGHIAKIYRDVSPKTHSDEIIRDLQTLQQSVEERA